MTSSAAVPAPDEFRANKLLDALPDAERDHLRGHLRAVTLDRRKTLYEPERPIPAVYFVTDGIVSILSVMEDSTAVETATIGREGFVGMPLFHGVDITAELAMVQVPGRALHLDADAFRRLLPELPTLTRLLHRFSVALFTLAAQNSGCNRKHSIEQRCCRWLLMVADRLDRNVLELTHDFIAQMLGVRRASVTETLGHLEKRGMIRAGRGRITIVDRDAIRSCTCECYAIVKSTVDRLISDRDTPSPLDDVKVSEDGRAIVGDPHG